jgi:hypothetical protein
VDALRQFPFQDDGQSLVAHILLRGKSQLQSPSKHACEACQESTGLSNAPICPGICRWRQPDDAVRSLKN